MSDERNGWSEDDESASNVAGYAFAVASLGCGLVGLLVGQVLLSPLAIVLAAVGFHRAGSVISARRMAMCGYALGVFDGLLWLVLTAGFHLSGYPF